MHSRNTVFFLTEKKYEYYKCDRYKTLTCKELSKSKKMAALVSTLAVSPINQATPNIGSSKKTLRMPTLLRKKLLHMLYMIYDIPK